MDEHDIHRQFEDIKKDFGERCKKLSGSVTVELIRDALSKMGMKVSPRDVFIQGVPLEIDFLLTTPGAQSKVNLIYEPKDVLAAFEVKTLGCFGEGSIKSIKNNFELIKAVNRGIYCAYVSLAERKGYKWAATDDNIGSHTFTLFWHDGSVNNRSYKQSGDWNRLIDELNKLVHR
jgi:hypothetical protein